MTRSATWRKTKTPASLRSDHWQLCLGTSGNFALERLATFIGIRNSYARFTIPVFLDKDKDGKLASESHLNIISNADSLLMVGIPQNIKANMERVKNNSFGTSAFDLKVNNELPRSKLRGINSLHP
ncbi:hypothetical protein [Desulfuromonas sp. DDH964]|uniref:hypothetical protein n=1 Tax=Desulfuromonas sp. DDH964 TaxID=1823759 RepID=UPI0012F7D999|nr:hypothetical protein [Desulfuromonas sp. DDH964]